MLVPLKDLGFLLGIGQLLSDRTPSFPAMASFSIHHRTHNLMYIQHPQDFLPRKFHPTHLSLRRIISESQKTGFEENMWSWSKLPPEFGDKIRKRENSQIGTSTN